MPFRKQVTYSERPNHAARAAHAKGDQLFRTYDTSYIRPKKSKGPIVATIILVLLLIAGAVFIALRFAAPPTQELLPEGESAVITVTSGEGATDIGSSLAEAQLVHSSQEFIDAVRAAGAESSLIPGPYLFEGGVTPEEIVTILQTGPSATGINVTIPEGITREATAALFEEATGGRITADAFLAASSDASQWAETYPFLASAGTNSLEGFLFPKTYLVTAADDATSVVTMMLNQFQTETAGLSFDYPQSQGLSVYQAVNLAAIIEREVSNDPASMAKVASVFYNRLASDRPYLESDATTAYEVGREPTAEEVHAQTPYSTYANPGLPPTPICSPGLPSLQAVCNPEQTPYLYFYSTVSDDGQVTTYFAETYEEHQNNIAQG